MSPTQELDWVWVKTPSFINVAIVTKDGKWLLFHQTKYACTQAFATATLACVGGYIEEGEDPRSAALREMQEETGFSSNNLVHLGSAVPDANRGCGIGHMFLAIDAFPVQQTESDDLEEQLLLSWTTEQVECALLKGQFKCHSWYATMAGALLYHKQYTS
eukprot:CAMPEP_0175119832 /NCGR_PEP_ID=MMETSP0087-20121206/284_1 /TAXON_ID=136419 /ORGANISM="Unknown Unknown, Strain D1" /LENGTH=159 /DNA_ID=CAMNT_0016401211 /DNA_START=128 /DNA_END=607 /DNA_ORIENTATION=-